MKRFTALLLAVLYFSVSSGMVMNMHYCRGKLSSVKLSVMPDSKCICGKESARKMSCCKTGIKLIKLEDAQQKTVLTDLSFSVSVALPVYSLNLLHSSFYNEPPVYTQVNAPPLLSGQNTYLRNCVFRI